MEVMYIRSARCYDPKTKSIVFGNNQPCTVENQKAAHGGEEKYCELLYEFCHNMAAYKTDNSEYTLFTAICIFSGESLLIKFRYYLKFGNLPLTWGCTKALHYGSRCGKHFMKIMILFNQILYGVVKVKAKGVHLSVQNYGLLTISWKGRFWGIITKYVPSLNPQFSMTFVYLNESTSCTFSIHISFILSRTTRP